MMLKSLLLYRLMFYVVSDEVLVAVVIVSVHFYASWSSWSFLAFIASG